MGNGTKFDTGKPRFSLLPWRALYQVVLVLESGAKVHGEENWKELDNGPERYFDALMRHLYAWRCGERVDPDTGLPTLAHAACDVLFMLWFDLYPCDAAGLTEFGE